MTTNTLAAARRPEPFLFRFADKRIECAAIPGAYDPATEVWTLDTPAGRVPIVDAGPDDVLEIQTKTKVRQEADDEVDALVQMRTKTFVTEEVDDDQHVLAGLLEITTKTEAQIESEDQRDL